MRTIKEIKKEIDDIKHQLETEDLKKPVQSKLRKRIQFLNVCIRYIETNPNEDFIKSEATRIGEKITLRMKGFNEELWKDVDRKEFAKAKKAYEKEYEIPKLRTQVKTLKFLSV